MKGNKSRFGRVLAVLLIAMLMISNLEIAAFADGVKEVFGSYALDSSLSNVPENGSAEFKLIADTWGGRLNIDGNRKITIDLNGFRWVPDGDYADYFACVKSGSTLTIKSSSAAGVITSPPDVGIIVEGGTLIIEGGTIYNAGYDTNPCGGVLVREGGSFTMKGGAIKECKSSTMGGGVWIENGTFRMEGGAIQGNTAGTNGGGVYVGSNSSFTMTGGEIGRSNYPNKTTNGSGAGVYIEDDGNFTMSGGIIAYNQAGKADIGGGVAVAGSFSMSGGSIINNTVGSSGYGGGVFASGSKSISFSGSPVITGNKSGTSDNNVFIWDPDTLKITDTLTSGAKIGYSLMPNFQSPFVFTSGLKGRGTAANFSSDDGNYVIIQNSDGEAIPSKAYNIAIDTSENGTVSANLSKAASGQTVTLTVTPDSGYQVSSVKYGSTEIVPTAGVYSFEMPAEDVTVTATFSRLPATAPTITKQPTDLGFVRGTSSGNVLSVTASAASGHTLSYQWYSNTKNSTNGATMISGATSANYTIPTDTTFGTYYYCCVVTAKRQDNGNENSTTSNVATVTVNFDAAHFSQDGDTYTIRDAAGWDIFCDLLADNTKGYFTGKTVKLGDDIAVTRMAGSSHHDFTGIFDGQGHALTIAYGSAESPITDQYAAPFRNVESGANIHGLVVEGDIYTSAKYAAGIVGNQYGTVTVSDCRSSVAIHSSVEGDGTHGGFVAANNESANLMIEGCVFDGSLLGNTTDRCGGFIGWRNGSAVIRNSLFTPDKVTVLNSSSATFACNTVDTYNSYYTSLLNDGTNFVPSLADGTVSPAKWYNGMASLTVSAGDEFTTCTVSPAGDSTNTYNVSGITAYANGIVRDGTFYYGSGDTVSLTLGHADAPEGKAFTGFAASAGTLSGAENPYTLTMPVGHVTVTAVWEDAATAPAFRSHSLVLTGLIGVNFFMELPKIEGVDYSNSYMSFSVSGRGGKTSSDTYDAADMNDAGTLYKFTCYVTSIQMADTITAQFHYSENGTEKTISQTYSVAQYMRDFDAVSGGYSQKTIAAVHALADLGHYVQPVLAATNNWKLGTDHAIMNGYRTSGYSEDEVNTVRDAVADHAIVRDTGNSKIQAVTYKLHLDSSTTISLFLRVEDGYKGSVEAYLDNGTGNAAVLQQDGRYRMQIPDISAHQLGVKHTIRVVADQEFTITVSALSYIQTVLNSDTYRDDTAMINAVASLYNYYDAVMTYRKQ